ncbi:MAG: Gfo/Idh/MocA family oxidoreductase [Burkholderiales bacterium]|nr:Gfo/Idh/MocA family oxidoreductase [Burkholderiales bacterium]
MTKYNVAVLGCGAIFSRHLAALQANHEEYNFVGYYDPSNSVNKQLKKDLPTQKAYNTEDDVYNDNNINCIIILTPSYLHYEQAKKALLSGKNVIVEKPVAFKTAQLNELELLSKKQNLDFFCILQVRLNPSISLVKSLLSDELLGEIRGCSLVQRWQRPDNYFSGWRGTYQGCGGVLNEFGIHYLDIMQYLLGVPNVVAAKFFNTKFKNSEVSDSVYAIFDFGNFGGSMEITLATEPRNIEVSLLIMGSKGFIKLGGKSLDQIIEVAFQNEKDQLRYQEICEQVLGYKIDNQVTIGACPHHPELYKQILTNKNIFDINQTKNVINLINQINNLDK